MTSAEAQNHLGMLLDTAIANRSEGLFPAAHKPRGSVKFVVTPGVEETVRRIGAAWEFVAGR